MLGCLTAIPKDPQYLQLTHNVERRGQRRLPQPLDFQPEAGNDFYAIDSIGANLHAAITPIVKAPSKISDCRAHAARRLFAVGSGLPPEATTGAGVEAERRTLPTLRFGSA